MQSLDTCRLMPRTVIQVANAVASGGNPTLQRNSGSSTKSDGANLQFAFVENNDALYADRRALVSKCQV